MTSLLLGHIEVLVPSKPWWRALLGTPGACVPMKAFTCCLRRDLSSLLDPLMVSLQLGIVERLTLPVCPSALQVFWFCLALNMLALDELAICLLIELVWLCQSSCCV